jgi:prevent-host-death family protein
VPTVSRTTYKGVEDARRELPELLDAAVKGEPTVITRRGQPVAALVPLAVYDSVRQQSLLPLAGSGRRLWGRSSAATVDRLRGEWEH